MATANPLAGPSALKDIIDPQFYQNNFPAELYIKKDLNLKLDKGKQTKLSFLLREFIVAR